MQQQQQPIIKFRGGTNLNVFPPRTIYFILFKFHTRTPQPNQANFAHHHLQPARYHIHHHHLFPLCIIRLSTLDFIDACSSEVEVERSDATAISSFASIPRALGNLCPSSPDPPPLVGGLAPDLIFIYTRPPLATLRDAIFSRGISTHRCIEEERASILAFARHRDSSKNQLHSFINQPHIIIIIITHNMFIRA